MSTHPISGCLVFGYRQAEHVLPQHRVEVKSKRWEFVNVCVARLVGRKERMGNLQAKVSMDKEIMEQPNTQKGLGQFYRP